LVRFLVRSVLKSKKRKIREKESARNIIVLPGVLRWSDRERSRTRYDKKGVDTREGPHHFSHQSLRCAVARREKRSSRLADTNRETPHTPHKVVGMPEMSYNLAGAARTGDRGKSWNYISFEHTLTRYTSHSAHRGACFCFHLSPWNNSALTFPI